jgi:hypothetical protein
VWNWHIWKFSFELMVTLLVADVCRIFMKAIHRATSDESKLTNLTDLPVISVVRKSW